MHVCFDEIINAELFRTTRGQEKTNKSGVGQFDKASKVVVRFGRQLISEQRYYGSNLAKFDFLKKEILNTSEPIWI